MSRPTTKTIAWCGTKKTFHTAKSVRHSNLRDDGEKGSPRSEDARDEVMSIVRHLQISSTSLFEETGKLTDSKMA